MGCLAKMGCLVVLAALAVGGWITRDRWLHRLPGFDGTRAGETQTGSTWQRLTPEGATRARTALRRLEGRSGPVYANVAPGDLAAYVFQELSGALPESADSVEAAVVGDRLVLRAIIPTSLLGSRESLGPMAMLLGERERVQLGGNLRIVRPGLGEFRVREVTLRDFTLPEPLIPRIVGQLARSRPAEIARDALPLNTPPHIADVRIANGRVTLYRTLPAER